MALARWGQDGSDIYLYDVQDGGFECCCCGLQHGETLHLTDNKEAMAHVQRHVAAGHVVPLYTYAILKKGKFSQISEMFS